MENRRNRIDTNFPKEKYTLMMAEHLPALRMMLGVNQDEFAELIGSSRQMLSLIERGVRPMMWDTFMSMLYVLRRNDATREMMTFLGVYTDELEQFLDIQVLPRTKRMAAFGGRAKKFASNDEKQKQEAVEKSLKAIKDER